MGYDYMRNINFGMPISYGNGYAPYDPAAAQQAALNMSQYVLPEKFDDPITRDEIYDATQAPGLARDEGKVGDDVFWGDVRTGFGETFEPKSLIIQMVIGWLTSKAAMWALTSIIGLSGPLAAGILATAFLGLAAFTVGKAIWDCSTAKTDKQKRQAARELGGSFGQLVLAAIMGFIAKGMAPKNAGTSGAPKSSRGLARGLQRDTANSGIRNSAVPGHLKNYKIKVKGKSKTVGETKWEKLSVEELEAINQDIPNTHPLKAKINDLITIRKKLNSSRNAAANLEKESGNLKKATDTALEDLKTIKGKKFKVTIDGDEVKLKNVNWKKLTPEQLENIRTQIENSNIEGKDKLLGKIDALIKAKTNNLKVTIDGEEVKLSKVEWEKLTPEQLKAIREEIKTSDIEGKDGFVKKISSLLTAKNRKAKLKTQADALRSDTTNVDLIPAANDVPINEVIVEVNGEKMPLKKVDFDKLTAEQVRGLKTKFEGGAEGTPKAKAHQILEDIAVAKEGEAKLFKQNFESNINKTKSNLKAKSTTLQEKADALRQKRQELKSQKGTKKQRKQLKEQEEKLLNQKRRLDEAIEDLDGLDSSSSATIIDAELARIRGDLPKDYRDIMRIDSNSILNTELSSWERTKQSIRNSSRELQESVSDEHGNIDWWKASKAIALKGSAAAVIGGEFNAIGQNLLWGHEPIRSSMGMNMSQMQMMQNTNFQRLANYQYC